MNSAFDLLKAFARLFGVFISYYPPPGGYERRMRDYLQKSRINVVLDVGAYIGDYARELRDLGYRGRIISFEPVRASYEKLEASMRSDPLWSGQPYGLSDQDREAIINTYSLGNYNSLLNLHDDAERACSLDPSRRGKASIQLRRLDSVLPELVKGIPSPRVFLKMDTQGSDLSVVKGATGILDMIFGMQSELPVIPIYDGMPSMAGGLDFYTSCGFRPIGFYPVHTFEDIQITPEFDVVLNRFDGRLARD